MADIFSSASVFTLAGYTVSCLLGFLVLRRVFCDREKLDAVIFFLSPGMGFAITCVILFLQVYCLGQIHAKLTIAAHCALVAVLWIKRPKRENSIPFEPRTSLWMGGTLLLAAFFIIFKLLQSPYGFGLDAWAIWHLKARFLYQDPFVWSHLFTQDLNFSHPDYPLFYPLVMVWGWMSAAMETHVASPALSIIFSLSLLGLLMSALADRWRWGWVSGPLLLSTPHWVHAGALQYADIIVAYYLLASVIMLDRAWQRGHRCYAFVGGFLAGTASFVKNEGILFLILIFVICAARRRLIKWILLGMVPLSACTLAFKTRVAYSHEVFYWQNVQEKINSGLLGERFIFIINYISKELLHENRWVYAWVFLIILGLFYVKSLFRREHLWITSGLVLMALGYVVTYMMTPINLELHLATSLNRLLIHLFPLAVYNSFHHDSTSPFVLSQAGHENHGRAGHS